MAQNLKTLRANGARITRPPFSTSVWWIVPIVAVLQLVAKLTLPAAIDWVWIELIATAGILAAELGALWRHDRYLQIVRSQIVELDHQAAAGRTLLAQLEDQAKNADTWIDYAASTALFLANIPLAAGRFALGAALSAAIGGEFGMLVGQTPPNVKTVVESARGGVDSMSHSTWVDSSLPSTKLKRQTSIVHESIVALEAQVALRDKLIKKREVWRNRIAFEGIAVAVISAPMIATISFLA